MYGNLSKTIVNVPKAFHLSAYITSSTLAENRYKEPAIYDTFSYLRKINKRGKSRYFRLNEHFKENSPYSDLNFNNNKRYVSPISKLKTFISLNYFINKKIRKSISQTQLLSKTNSMNLSKTTNKEISKDNNNETHSSQIINIINNSIKENNQFKQQMDFSEEKNNLSKISEALPLEENTKNNNKEEETKLKQAEESEDRIKLKNYMNKLIANKPHNLKELKSYLKMNYADEEKRQIVFPRIGKVKNSISQDDLFKKTLIMKLSSLSMIRPEVKEGIFKRKKNIIMKRDFDMLRRIYNVRKKLPFHLRNIISYEALVQE